MSKYDKGKRAVLVLPDMGIEEKALDIVKEDFQNSLIGSLRKAGSEVADTVVVVVVVVVVS